MCDPVTAAVVVGGLAGYGEYQQGEADLAVAKYNARTMQNNATKVENAATEEENKLRRKTAAEASRQKAEAAASGRDVNSLYTQEIFQDTEMIGDEDALTIRRNAADRADTMREQAKTTLLTGRNALRMSRLRTVTSSASAGTNTYAGLS